jgi:hypothetical protein
MHAHEVTYVQRLEQAVVVCWVAGATVPVVRLHLEHNHIRGAGNTANDAHMPVAVRSSW